MDDNQQPCTDVAQLVGAQQQVHGFALAVTDVYGGLALSWGGTTRIPLPRALLNRAQ